MYMWPVRMVQWYLIYVPFGNQPWEILSQWRVNKKRASSRNAECSIVMDHSIVILGMWPNDPMAISCRFHHRVDDKFSYLLVDFIGVPKNNVWTIWDLHPHFKSHKRTMHNNCITSGRGSPMAKVSPLLASKRVKGKTSGNTTELVESTIFLIVFVSFFKHIYSNIWGSPNQFQACYKAVFFFLPCFSKSSSPFLMIVGITVQSTKFYFFSVIIWPFLSSEIRNQLSQWSQSFNSWQSAVQVALDWAPPKHPQPRIARHLEMIGKTSPKNRPGNTVLSFWLLQKRLCSTDSSVPWSEYGISTMLIPPVLRNQNITDPNNKKKTFLFTYGGFLK